MSDYWQNEQFAEDDDEIAERQRLARIKARCPECGRNPKLGQDHMADCNRRPMPSPQGTKS